MAKISGLPNRDVIDMLAGTIDYYAYLGIPCARKWPVKHFPPTSAEKEHWGPFRYVNQVAKELPPKVVHQWTPMIEDTYLTWKDMLNRAYLGHTFNPPYLPKTGERPLLSDRFLILDWEMTETAHYWNFTFYTDVACRLWLMRLEKLPERKIIPRERRGYRQYLDVYYQYYSESAESPRPYPETREHHWQLNKLISIYKNGFFFWATINDNALSSISQYFSPRDLGL